MLQGGEILLILIIALLVFGPERLPGIARKLGEWTHKVRRSAADLTRGLEAEIDQLRQLAEETGRPITEVRDELRKAVDESGMSRLEWVGPKPISGPTPEDALRDLDRIEGQAAPSDTGGARTGGEDPSPGSPDEDAPGESPS